MDLISFLRSKMPTFISATDIFKYRMCISAMDNDSIPHDGHDDGHSSMNTIVYNCILRCKHLSDNCISLQRYRCPWMGKHRYKRQC